jgi:hypothetical protein
VQTGRYDADEDVNLDLDKISVRVNVLGWKRKLEGTRGAAFYLLAHRFHNLGDSTPLVGPTQCRQSQQAVARISAA